MYTKEVKQLVIFIAKRLQNEAKKKRLITFEDKQAIWKGQYSVTIFISPVVDNITISLESSSDESTLSSEDRDADWKVYTYQNSRSEQLFCNQSFWGLNRLKEKKITLQGKI